MGGLAFRKKWNADGDEGVVVAGNEAVEEGTAEALDSRGRAFKPKIRDTEDSAITAPSRIWWRKCKGKKRGEKRRCGTCGVRGTNDAV